MERLFGRFFEDKGAAQAKRERNGKAKPFLTTGREAVPKRKSCQERKQEVAHLLMRINNEISKARTAVAASAGRLDALRQLDVFSGAENPAYQ